MNVQGTNFFNKQVNFKAFSDNKSSTENKKGPTFLDVVTTSAKNSADLNDTIEVPRTIFKGYLSFMAGTALGALAPLAKNRKYLSKGLNIAASALALLGTYFFVRPYVIKDANPKKQAGLDTKADIKCCEACASEKISEKEQTSDVPVKTPVTQ